MLSGNFRRLSALLFVTCSWFGVSGKPWAVECKPATTDLNIHYFVNNNTPQGQFWSQNIAFANWVAKALGITLTIHNIAPEYQHRVLFQDVIQEAIEQSNTMPNYFIGPLFHKGADRLFADLSELNIPYFTLNTTMLHRQKSEYGEPREKSPLWIGHISPNDREPAYQMARSATEQLVAINQEPIVIIIAGEESDTVSISRTNGYLQGLMEFGIFPTQTYHTDWAEQGGERAASAALRRFEKIDLLLTASSTLSAGAKRVFSQEGASAPSLHYSFNWSERAARLISDSNLVSTFGGHFSEAGLALVLLYDHFRGADFEKEYGKVLFTTTMSEMNEDNAQAIRLWLENESWQNIDIKQFSRCENQEADIESLTPSFMLQYKKKSQ